MIDGDIDIRPDEDIEDSIEAASKNLNSFMENTVAEIVQDEIEEHSDISTVPDDLNLKDESSKKLTSSDKKKSDQNFFNIGKNYKIITGGAVVIDLVISYLFYKKAFKFSKSDVKYLKQI